MSFSTYRQKAGYSPASIRVQDSHLRRFTIWCQEHGICYEKITYSGLLEFIDHERERGLAPGSIAQQINSIRVFYDYLIKQGSAKENLFNKIRIRDQNQKVLPEIFSPEKLKRIYQDYSDRPDWRHPSARAALLHKRNTVVLGLLIFQGLVSGNLAELQTSHIDLEKSTIYIPSGRKSNARVLSLQAAQILTLKTYLENIRPHLKDDHQEESTLVFAVRKHGEMVRRIINQVKRQHPELTGSRQIRASVIVGWLKSNNIRQVQYMAGHKSIRTTESLRRQDLTGLVRQLELFHPIK